MSQCWLPRLSLPELLLLLSRGGLTNLNEDEENFSENISEDFHHFYANMSKTSDPLDISQNCEDPARFEMSARVD